MHETLWNALLTWYAAHQRDLPWRQTRDPYAILISETMLQQTGVERVIPKYHAFLARFPSLRALTDAPAADVIRLWSGLGYNRRAVWLQRAARQALERWGGLPSRIEDLRSLPGIGLYTASAVACFAFGTQVAVNDTNVRRVLARVLLGGAATTDARLLALAESVLPPGRAYDWNQALMDLGATICTHDAPRCLICPLQSLCQAFALGQTRIDSALSAVGEGRPRWKEAPFAGSRRYYRGRIVEALRQLKHGDMHTLSSLGPLVKDGFSDAETLWLRGLLEELAADGLVRLDGDRTALP